MGKHTEGPWGIEQYHGEINIVSCNERDAEDGRLGIVYVLAQNIGGRIHGENFDDRSELEANANLIMTAPDLLADLVNAAAQLRTYEALHREKGTEESTAKAEVNATLAARFEATIARARGEE